MKKKKLEYISHKKMQIYEILQLLRVFIFLNNYIIVHYQFLLSIVNVVRCDHFILLNLYTIYLFLCSCHYFIKIF